MSWGGNGVEAVARNRVNYFASAGLNPERVVSAEQVHGSVIGVVTVEDAGKGALHPRDRIAGTDGFVTNVQGLVLTTLHADCAPVFFADERNRAIGLAHCGWKGILAGLPGKMLHEMGGRFGFVPREIQVAIGPMICTEHYAVTEERAGQFRERFGPQIVMQLDGKPYLDLWAAIVYDLLGNGLGPERIPARPPCTFSNAQYPSYRRDGPPAQSMLAWIMIP